MHQTSLFPATEPQGHELSDDELADVLNHAMLTSGSLTARADLELACINARFLVNRLRLAGLTVYARDRDRDR